MSDADALSDLRELPDLGNHRLLERITGPTTLSAVERAEAISLLEEAINQILASASYTTEEKLALTTRLSALADRLDHADGAAERP